MRALLPSVLLFAVPVVAQDIGTNERLPALCLDASAAEEVSDGLSAEEWTAIRTVYLARITIAQQAYLKASNTGLGDYFGESVAASGNTVLVGAGGEGSDSTGVNGDERNDNSPSSGAVYVFVRTGTSWSQQAYLKASNTGPGDSFGSAVAISGNTAVIGARAEDSDSTGVGGDQGNNNAPMAGSAYVFVRTGTDWSQQAYLKASNTDAWDAFGDAVAVSGDTVVVSATNESSNATGVNGNENSNSAPGSGAAYVFSRTGTDWSQQAYLKASNTDQDDRFGRSIGVSGDTVVVGAYWEDSGSVGVNGDQNDNSASSAGAAYVFVRNGTTWSQDAYLKASNAEFGDQFGSSVAVSGESALVAAFFEDSAATGVNGNQNDNSQWGAGAAYVFVRPGTAWTQQAYLKASNSSSYDHLGWSAALSGNTAVVGARQEDSGSPGVNGDQGDNSAQDAGAAYVFERNGVAWSQLAYLKASNPDGWPIADYFGVSVAVSDGAVVVGADHEDSRAPGVNGNQDDNSSQWAGAAYAYGIACDSLPSVETARLGSPPNPNAFLPGVSSGPIVGTIWDPMIDHTSFAPGAAVDFVGISTQGPLNAPTAWGTLLILPPYQMPIRVISPPGTPFSIPIPARCSLVGLDAWTQGGSVSPGFVIEFANALDLTLGTF